MANLVISDLNEHTHQRLKEQAAQNDRSVEAEARHLLDQAVGTPEKNIALAFYELGQMVGGVDIEAPTREAGFREVEV